MQGLFLVLWMENWLRHQILIQHRCIPISVQGDNQCSFFIGLFYGVFVIDVVYSTHLITTLKKLSDEYDVVVRYEELKARIRASHDERKTKYRFFQPFRSDTALALHVKAMKASFEEQKAKRKTGK